MSNAMTFWQEQYDRCGWLGFAGLRFDNSCKINVYTSNGYVAYSPSKKCFFCFKSVDSADTSVIEGQYTLMDDKIVGQQQTLCVIGEDVLQWIDLALYSHEQFYTNDQKATPYPHIPTREQLDALVKDEETGLYAGTDTIGLYSGKQVSAISMYPQEAGKESVKHKDGTAVWYYSGAIVDSWKRFYKNHDKFCTMLKEAYGITDAI